MTWAKPAFRILAYLFLVGVGVQFLLAGLGTLGGESIDPHRDFGFMVLHTIPLLMIILAVVGKMGKKMIGMSVLLFVLVFLQALFADPELDPMWIRSLHVLNAFLIAGLGHHIAQWSGKLFTRTATA
jgi:uncharacterized membrane protein YwaF